MDDRWIESSYQILQEIGEGGTGKVFLGYHRRLQKYVVLKYLHRKYTGLLSRREADILKNLRHTNLPVVYDIIQESDTVITVMDYIEGNPLSRYLESGVRPTQRQIVLWLSQLFQVLSYLHRQEIPIIHCDIKPENIIITPHGDAVLIDFGMSLVGQSDRLRGISKPYASPEQAELADQLYYQGIGSITLDARTDIYSLAATFYHLMSGIQPSPKALASPLSDMDLDYSEALTDLIDKAMQFDRRDRPSDAATLQRAVDRLKLRDKGYAALLAAQVISILLSAALVATGISCWITGSARLRSEQYTKAYDAVYAAMQDNDAERARILAEDLLQVSEFQELLDRRPQDRAGLLMLLGDISYAEDRFLRAANYYRQAQEFYGTEGSNALCNEIIALVQSGNLNAAQSRLDAPEALGLSQEEYLMVAAILAGKRGDGVQAAEWARQLLTRTDDSELCARAAIAAAESAGSTPEKITWLETASRYGGSLALTRMIASAYAQFGMEAGDATAEAALSKAISYYKTLNSDAIPSRMDRLNYAIVLRAAGYLDQALEVLRLANREYPNDYRIVMYLAFVSYDLGDDGNAIQYGRTALSAWRADLSEDRLRSDSEELTRLWNLADRLGFS